MHTESPWLGLTVLLGFGFLAGQLWVWNILRHQGVYRRSNTGGFFFYLLSGVHAVHLLGGLLALVFVMAGIRTRMKVVSQGIAVDVIGWYWHFVGILWIYIFLLLHFVKGGAQ